jgi:translation elongation factor EF-1alpha
VRTTEEVKNMAEEVEGRLVGKITHYFGKISVGVIELEDTLKVGDTIHVKGATADFAQPVDSMQIEHEQVQEAGPGDCIGLRVVDKVHEGDKVYVV